MRLLEDNPVLLLFVVAALGVLGARIRVRGISFGVAAVLFAGIGLGAADRKLAVPEEIWMLGLALFVYTVGIASGPGFVRALRRRGLAANAAVLGALTAAAGAAFLVHVAADVARGSVAGAFAGGETNTPALAALLEAVRHATRHEAALPVVGYSLSYPLGVLVPLLAVQLVLRHRLGTRPRLVSRSVVVEHPAGALGAVSRRHEAAVTFGRIRHAGALAVATDRVEPAVGDVVSVVGLPEDVAEVVAELGHEADDRIELDRHELDFRRIVLSSRAAAGRRLGDLGLPARFDATVTRIRRGDLDFVAQEDTMLELGDRLRVVAPRRRMDEISRFLGDSYRALGEIDVLCFSVGIAAGLALGLVPVPLPGGGTFTLGFAGGPLVVGLVLGALGRTGPLVWQLPYTASLTLRQFGTIVFLAGIGIRAGSSFGSAVSDPSSAYVFLAGLLTTAAAVSLLLLAGTKLLHLSPETLAGTIAGMQTQPAVLALAAERVDDDHELNVAYAAVYPLAMVAKLVLAVILLG
ncbi:MAG TPA: TrkA C-terminal domain-containing protein [Gaiellaceae bacterium]|nr:TrkA C-terminal domain-containing protein [Gaiellaceae bacterium]